MGLSGVESTAPPRLLRLRVLQSIDVAVLADLAQVAHVRRGDLAAPTPATGEAKAEQGTVTPAFQAVIAGGQHGL